MLKIKPDTLTAGMVKNHCKGTIHLQVQSKEHKCTGNSFIYDVLTMAKQLGILTYIDIVMCWPKMGRTSAYY